MIRIDPENNEPHALFDFADFTGKHVLEIGCGDGRLTWRYANKAAHVTAIEPSDKQIALARKNLPKHLRGRIEFHVATLEEFAVNSKASVFDIVILSYSLC
ncbi:MAG: class I SAM-dependent methyltransferase [Anaerolineae bacterium]|nr:class I SAM-dependent methyltransferase [Anaerolineae bacterium]MCI0607697.1 class I SAM-dependent methyltransferase [Anaerolineae bacterium]